MSGRQYENFVQRYEEWVAAEAKGGRKEKERERERERQREEQ
jgi:hypothetical protein